MSAEARPISPSRFALALQDLPIENIYAKAFEINNSIAHLERSNTQLQEYSDSIKNDESLDAATRAAGDKDCLDAIRENQVVVERQKERVALLKAEVERRGGRWHEADTAATTTNGQKEEEEDSPQAAVAVAAANTATSRGGRLTDEELRRQMEARMGGSMDDDGEEEEGMHL